MQTLTHDRSRTPARLGLVVVAFILTMVGVFGTSAATASQPDVTRASVAASTFASGIDNGAGQGNKSGSPSVCAPKMSEGKVDYLPVYRWSDATGNFHTRYSATDIANVPDRVVSIAFTGTGFAIGNAMWQITTNLVQVATRACPIDSVGGLVDNYAAKIAKSVMDSGLLTTLVIIGFVGIVFRGLRQGGNIQWKSMMPKVMALALFGALMGGAVASTGGGANGDHGTYRPGVGSPGWFATKIDRTIASLTAFPVEALTNDTSVDSLGGSGGKPEAAAGTRNNFLNSCPYYVAALKQKYTDGYEGSAGAMISATPKALSAMWETTGLRSWRKTQFGDKNYSGSHMYCYALDKSVDVPVSASESEDGNDKDFDGGTVSEITTAMKIGAPHADAPVWRRTSDNDELDRQLVMLAECRLVSGKLNGTKGANRPVFGLRKLGKGDKYNVTQEACEAAFGIGKATDQEVVESALGNATATGAKGVFDWSPRERKSVGKAFLDTANPFGGGGGTANAKAVAIGSSTIDKYARDDGSRDFLRSLHGDSKGTSMVMTIAYVISSFSIMVAFGMISIAILVAKTYALVLIFMIFFVIMGTLLPGADNTKLVQFVKQYAGLSFFIFGFQLILAILVLITKILIQVGNDAFSNDFANMIWAGFSPVLALISMHMMFKKMGMPSPLSINAGKSWGKAAAAGAIGGAAGGALGAGLMSRLGNSARDIGKGALSNSIGNRNNGKGPDGSGGGKGNRVNTMKPGEKAGGKEATGDLDENATEGDADTLQSSTPENATPTAGERVADTKASLAKMKSDMAGRRADRAETSRLDRAKASVSKSVGNAASNIRNHPVKTLAKTGLAVGAAMAIPAAVPGALLGYGLYKGVKKGTGSVATMTGMNTEANRDAVARATKKRAEIEEANHRAEAAQKERDAVMALAEQHEAEIIRKQEQRMWDDHHASGDASGPRPGDVPNYTTSAPSLEEFAAAHQNNMNPFKPGKA